MDDLSVKVSPVIDKRTVTFEVSPEEANRICTWLQERININAPQEVKTTYAGFKAIADRRNFGGH